MEDILQNLAGCRHNYPFPPRDAISDSFSVRAGGCTQLEALSLVFNRVTCTRQLPRDFFMPLAHVRTLHGI